MWGDARKSARGAACLGEYHEAGGVSTPGHGINARRVGARARAVRRVAPASRVDLHTGRAPDVAADGLADLEPTLAGLVLEVLHRGLELRRHEVAVDIVPVLVVGRAGERHVVSTGPHLGTVGPRLASQFHPHARIMRRRRRRASPACRMMTA